MVCRAKLLSLRSRYVISGWSLLRKQQKMKEIPRPLLFLGAMATILCVPPSWALDPAGKRRVQARAAAPQRCAPVPRWEEESSHPRARHGGEEQRRFSCQIFLLRFDVYSPGNLDDHANEKRCICFASCQSWQRQGSRHCPRGMRSPGPHHCCQSQQICTNLSMPWQPGQPPSYPHLISPHARGMENSGDCCQNSWMCLGPPGPHHG